MAAGVPIHGRVLAELRLVRLLTQAELAQRCQDHDRHCGLTTKRIGEYEREELRPSMANLRVIAEVLALDAGEVRALIHTTTLQLTPSIEEDGTDRRDAFKGMAALIAAGPLQRLAQASPVPPVVDDALLDDLGAVSTALGALYPVWRPSDLSDPVRDHLNRLTRALGRPMLPGQRNRLLGLLADTATLAGYVALDLNRLGESWGAFWVAERAAREDGDDAVRALVLMSVSWIGSATVNVAGGRTPSTLALVEQASQLAAAVPPLARSRLYTRVADERAAADDRAGAVAALGQAEEALAGAGEQEMPLRWLLDGWGPVRLVAIGGGVSALLGDTARAEEQLSYALARTVHPARRCTSLTRLALAQVHARRPDQAAAALLDAVSAAQAGDYQAGADRVHGVRTRFPQEWAGLGCVVELDERLCSAT